ncbi:MULTISPECIES: nucleotidyltransferase family protein [Cysteiniphilum]|uniref:Alcohol dehydrogenase n=1 Tax=Cysteiniphilum litorale TaxID=2056700 RepID=A0A8J2Z3P7_9GAMM|nr:MULTISPECIES: nucleotidyltransferase family protein [Cysteiniphilum]GGF94467.1 alcohol dehydrogenase [Cysteiniphilum litorale]
MLNIENVLISPKILIVDAMKALDKGASQILLVVDSEQKLLGTITDGDIRRAILSGVSLNDPVQGIMNKHPLYFIQGEKFDLKQAKEKHITKVPIIDQQNVVVDLFDVYEDRETEKENIVVLMAGGLGTRLRPLTDKKPKPLLDVGQKPILETIIENFAKHGFRKFYLSVNYKADMIKEHFKDGSHLGVQIEYLQETHRLGTAGALSLLDKEKVNSPFFVMNGDLLTNVDFQKMLDFHLEQKSLATVGVREYDFQVPYGVIKTKNGYVSSIVEKPVHNFFVSAGMYLLEPELLNHVPVGEFYDMPTLLSEIIEQSKPVSSFPIHEYWLDIGRMDEYHKANSEYKDVFI